MTYMFRQKKHIFNLLFGALLMFVGIEGRSFAEVCTPADTDGCWGCVSFSNTNSNNPYGSNGGKIVSSSHNFSITRWCKKPTETGNIQWTAFENSTNLTSEKLTSPGSATYPVDFTKKSNSLSNSTTQRSDPNGPYTSFSVTVSSSKTNEVSNPTGNTRTGIVVSTEIVNAKTPGMSNTSKHSYEFSSAPDGYGLSKIDEEFANESGADYGDRALVMNDRSISVGTREPSFGRITRSVAVDGKLHTRGSSTIADGISKSFGYENGIDSGLVSVTHMGSWLQYYPTENGLRSFEQRATAPGHDCGDFLRIKKDTEKYLVSPEGVSLTPAAKIMSCPKTP